MNNQTPDKKGTMTSVWQEQKKKNEIVKEEPPYNDLISIVKEEPHDFDTEEEEHLLEGELMEMQQPDPPSMEYHV